MGYEKDGFAFLTDRFVRSETVLVKYFADAKCEISAVALVKLSAYAKSERKSIPSRPQAFHMAKPHFTCEANFTNPRRDLFR